MVTFTPEANNELRERVTSLDEPLPGVAVSWLPAQRDLIRTAEGKAVWIEPEPNRWVVVVMSLAELPFPDKIASIGDLQVYFHPEGSGVQQVLVAFEGGEFRVLAKDA
jgi:hypothetical protein